MKSKLNHIIKSKNFASFSGNLLFAVLSFSSIMVLARTYDKSSFGEWILYLSLLTFFDMLRTGFTKTALVRILSGTPKNEQPKFIGSSLFIGFSFTILLAVLTSLIYLIFYHSISSSAFNLFFLYFPFTYICLVPFNYANYILQAQQNFGRVIIIKVIQQGTFFSLIVWNSFYSASIETIVLYHLLSISFSSLFSIFTGWSKISYLKHKEKNTIKELFHFGKYSAGTLLGTNLLKSSDTLLIGALMGPTAVAVYSIPLKLTEVFEISLRSFVNVALPQLAKAALAKNYTKVKQTFYKYSGILTLLYLPAILIAFIFAKEFVALLGGEKYEEAYIIFRIFIIYGFFLPIDRFSGVTLDSLNLPRANMVKVFLMVSANIIGDLIAILLFDNLYAIAVVTITTVITGVFIGLRFLNTKIKVHFFKIFTIGWYELSLLILKLKTK